jgi:hypothetical protein
MIQHVKTLRASAFALMAIATLSLASCKDKASETENPQDTVAPEGMSAVPAGDTIIDGNDTVVKSGPTNSTEENPIKAGEQVP